ALAVGYDSHSSFSHAFRQFYGKTPNEYRLQGSHLR
ncbi:helix-turn-helix domain-containing protein, partial [Escherichia coli]|nr:helix-turn-helix domain-containing protein [Escherichia coli]